MSFCITFTVVVLGCNKDLEDSENPREVLIVVSVAHSSIGQSSNITRFFYANFTFAVIRRRSIDRDDSAEWPNELCTAACLLRVGILYFVAIFFKCRVVTLSRAEHLIHCTTSQNKNANSRATDQYDSNDKSAVTFKLLSDSRSRISDLASSGRMVDQISSYCAVSVSLVRPTTLIQKSYAFFNHKLQHSCYPARCLHCQPP